MSDIIFQAILLVVMICVAIATRYVVPFVRESLGAENLQLATDWVRSAVLFAQQTMWAKSGAERKAYVVEYVTDLCARKNITLTEQQIEILIEAAVKEMKIDEAQGQTFHISATVDDKTGVSVK